MAVSTVAGRGRVSCTTWHSVPSTCLALLALTGLVAACPDDSVADAGPGADAARAADAGPQDGATIDAAVRDAAAVDAAGADRGAGVDGAPDHDAATVGECEPGAIPAGGCLCDGELHGDGYCCLDRWQASPCQAGTPVTACGLLDQPGTTYQLQNDVEANGHCFVIKGDDITLDLNGHTVGWTSPDASDWYFAVLDHTAWPSLPADWQGGGDRFRVTNGAIVQRSSGRACADASTSTGTATHAVYLRSCDGCEIDHLDITVGCHDTTPIWVRSGDSPRVHHNVIHNAVETITDRHFPGESSIWLSDCTGHARVYQNEILGGPHVGMRFSGDSATLVEVYGNRIAHHERYVNGYAIAAGASNLDIYANVIEPETGRGIHITGDHIVFRDNLLRIKEGAVIDQYGGVDEPGTWVPAHGVKIEGGHDQEIFGNEVIGEQPSDQYSPPSPLNLNSSASQGDISIHDNLFVATTALDPATGSTGYGEFAVYAPAIQALDCGANAGGAGYTLRNNVFQSNDRLLYVEYGVTCGGLLLEDNSFELLADATSNHRTFVLRGASPGVQLLDNRFQGFDQTDFDVGGSGSADVEIAVRARVTVQDSAGAVVEGAAVQWTDSAGTVVASGSSDSSGEHLATLLEVSYDTAGAPALTEHNPYQLRVTAAGFADHVEAVTVAAGTEIAVQLQPQ